MDRNFYRVRVSWNEKNRVRVQTQWALPSYPYRKTAVCEYTHAVTTDETKQNLRPFVVQFGISLASDIS